MSEQSAYTDGGQEAFQEAYQGDQGGSQETQAPDPVISHLQEMSTKLDSLIPPPAQTPSFDQIADPNFDPYGGYQAPEEPDYAGYESQPDYEQPQYGQQDGSQMSPEQAQQWIDQLVDQRVQQGIAPFIATQRARELQQQYPDLAKPETIQQIAPVAQQLAAQMGLPADAWRNPDFMLTIYQAQQARQNASQQIAPGEQQGDQRLEGGGAAAPGAAEEPNLAERLLAAYPHGREAAFWGG